MATLSRLALYKGVSMLDQQSILDRYTRGISGGGTAWLQGMQGMTENPAAKAASPQGMQNWLSGVQNSVEKRRNSLSRVTLADIQQAASAYGQQNYSASSTKAASKWAKKLPGMMSLWAAQKAAARAIPRVAGGDNLERVRAVVKLAQAAKGRL